MTITTEKAAKMQRVAENIAMDAQADASRWDGCDFNGRNVAEQLGEIRAQIHAPARLIDTMLQGGPR